MSSDAVPAWVRFTPDSPELRWAFERAYELANLAHEPASERSARRVDALLRDRYPDLVISVDAGSGWTVSEASPLTGMARTPVAL